MYMYVYMYMYTVYWDSLREFKAFKVLVNVWTLWPYIVYYTVHVKM